MYVAASFAAGLACKLYDDFVDNPLLQPYANPVFMEYLKGMHYILGTTVALHEPMFFVILYASNLLHYTFSPSSYELPYEKSTLYSFFFLGLILHTFRIDFSNLDYWFTAAYVCGHAFDPFIVAKDVSLFKMCVRFCWLCSSVFYTLYSDSNIVHLCYMYIAGYLTASVAVQAYSLYTDKFNEAYARYFGQFHSNQWCTNLDNSVDAFFSVKALLKNKSSIF
jgi:hypothetical protein